MGVLKHILFPTDFSENAKNAIFYGLSLYGDEPCKFFFLNTVPIIYDSSGFPMMLNDIITENANNSFNLLKKQIDKKFKHNTFNIVTECRVGELVSIISSFVNRQKITQIIMGTRGAIGVSELLVGSNTASVIKQVNCPVLAIPEKSGFKSLKKMVLAIDDENGLNKQVLKPILEMTNKYKSEVLILHVIKNNEEEKLLVKKKIEKLLKDIKHSYHFVYDENVPHGIEEFVKKQNASLLGMISRKHKFFERIFRRSITKKVSFHTKLPLLVIYDKK